MVAFRYTALDPQGKKRKGTVEAENEKEARDILRQRGLMVSSVTSDTGARKKNLLGGDQLVAFTVQLSQLVNAGIPLYESLLALEEQYRQEKFHPVLHHLCERIKAGQALSVAMEEYPGSFDRLYRAMVASGESVGALGPVLEKLSRYLTRQNALKKQIVTAMIYPGLLAGFCCLVIFLLVGFVVPSLEAIFADRELNSFTTAVLSVSHFLTGYWWVYLPLLAACVAFLYFQWRRPETQVKMERFLLRTPLIGTLMQQAAIARFSRTMATLIEGGLPMIEALRISRQVMQNRTLEEEMQKAEEKIVEGSSLSYELSRSHWVPRMVSRMIAVGEDAGNLPAMLLKVAEMYEDNVEKSLDRVMALAQPLILILMGGIIGTVLLAILLPLTDLSSFA